jgi:hypothetical protein
MARRIWDGTIDLDGYVRFLSQTYHYVCWTKPLLVRAGARLRRLGKYPVLAELFAVKAREEAGHEKWALADLRALGQEAAAINGEPPSAAVAAYIAWNGFVVESTSPVAFLGTAYVLESLSVRCGADAVRNLRRRRAIPGIEGAVSFLRGHAGADVGHLKQLGSLLAQIRDARDREAILLSARVTCTVYEGLFAPAHSPHAPRPLEQRQPVASAHLVVDVV